MATNEFLPFAADPAANCMLQSDYAASGFTARVLGFQTGTAISLQLNKVWRQASLIASMIGSFTVAQTGQNMLDDGSPAGLAALQSAFAAAVRQASTGGLSLNYLPLAGGTLTGPLNINANFWQVALNAPAGQDVGVWYSRPAGRGVYLQASTGTAPRWQLNLASNEPEGGGNAGSNFLLARFNDAGSFMDIPLRITRATGVVDFSATPTLRGGPLPYMSLTGGSFNGPLYVPSPGITYGGTEGHWVAFGWDGTAIVCRVDGTTAPGQLATRAYVTQVAGAYLPLTGGVITSNLNVNGGLYCVGNSGFANAVYFSGLSDFANFAGSNFRYRQWAGNWYDAWDGNNGRRFWIAAGASNASMQLDPIANLMVSGTFTTYGGRAVVIGPTPTLTLWWAGVSAMGIWTGSDNALWLGTTDGSNPTSGRNRFGADGTYTNWDGIRGLSWLQVDGEGRIGGNCVVNGNVIARGAGAALRVENTYPSMVVYNTAAGIGGGMRADGTGIVTGQADPSGVLNVLSALRYDGWFFTAGGIGTPSDASFKTSIRPSQDFDSLTALRALDSVAFEWERSGKHQPFGLLAGSVRDRLPDVVVRNEGYDYIDQAALLVHLIRAVQQLAQQIED